MPGKLQIAVSQSAQVCVSAKISRCSLQLTKVKKSLHHALGKKFEEKKNDHENCLKALLHPVNKGAWMQSIKGLV